MYYTLTIVNIKEDISPKGNVKEIEAVTLQAVSGCDDGGRKQKGDDAMR